MISIDEMQALLDELAEEFPEEFFRELSGGIVLARRAKRGGEEGLYNLGEYIHGGGLGRHIVIYYGSFLRVHGGLPRERMKERLRETLRHEFTHHLESMAGVKDLEAEDEKRLAEYRKRRKRD
jgi:hypothetical protein